METTNEIVTPDSDVQADLEGRVFRSLMEERPAFHGEKGSRDFSMPSKALSYLMQTVQPGWKTLEVGIGYSTVVFALRNARHTVISPLEDEHLRIRDWCNDHGLSFENVDFRQGQSEFVLPSLQAEPLDLVLIDGWHAFPSPFINWYFASNLLRVGGLIVLDDTQLRTYHTLKDFMMAEKGRWALEARINNFLGPSDAVAFRKLVPDVHRHFSQQPWMVHPVGRRRYSSIIRGFRRRIVSRLKRVI